MLSMELPMLWGAALWIQLLYKCEEALASGLTLHTARPRHTSGLPQSLLEGLTQSDATIFGGVMIIDVSVTFAAHLQVKPPVLGQCCDHMIQETCDEVLHREYLSGTFRTCQLSGFWHFSALSTTFASVCKHVVTWGGGGYVYTF